MNKPSRRFAVLLSGLLVMPAALTLAQTSDDTSNKQDTKVEQREKEGAVYSKEGAKLEKKSEKVGGKYGNRMHKVGKAMHKHGKKLKRKAEKKENKEQRQKAEQTNGPTESNPMK